MGISQIAVKGLRTLIPVEIPQDESWSNGLLSYASLHHRTHRGHQLTFQARPWLEALYKDNTPHKIVQKSTQIGITEYLIAQAFYFSEQKFSGLYVLPSREGMFTFVANRVDRNVLHSPRYTALLQEGVGSDSRALKHLGGGGIKFVGSNSVSSFIEYPADYVLLDEYDRCNHENIQLAYDRLKATFDDREPVKIEVSTPTLPDWGINNKFNLSNMMTWQVTCPHCGENQAPDWFENVVERVGNDWFLMDKTWEESFTRDVGMFCRSCGDPWTDKQRAKATMEGAFEAQNPNSKLRGYHLHRLLDTSVKLSTLWKDFHEARGDSTAMQIFYNSDLGLAYKPSGSGIGVMDLDLCRRDYHMPDGLSKGDDQGGGYYGTVTAGVDVGKQSLYVRISYYPSNTRRAAFIGRVAEFEELPPLFARYGVTTAVIDLNPETRKVRELQLKTPILYACQFSPGEKGKPFELRIDRKARLITVDRTQVIDRMVAGFQLHQDVLPIDVRSADNGAYYKHMQQPIRIEREAKGQRYSIWTERASGKDDYFLSEVYDVLARLINPEPHIRRV